ncbi:MAG: hypothetical protein Q7Q71_08305 [Verrucomicrobiota bacterium JB023]|nr:hypothetical protein [Verrucomicrobiota bacterium JB023]
MTLFNSYQEWRTTITERAGLTLDREFCQGRLEVLEDESSPETQSFIKSFGAAYHQEVVAWFHKALSEQ